MSSGAWVKSEDEGWEVREWGCRLVSGADKGGCVQEWDGQKVWEVKYEGGCCGVCVVCGTEFLAATTGTAAQQIISLPFIIIVFLSVLQFDWVLDSLCHCLESGVVCY